jgi:RimJ/RimL family protein N-acetyltransferase
MKQALQAKEAQLAMTISSNQPNSALLNELAYQKITITKGRIVGVREVVLDDVALISDLFSRLSTDTQWLRFFRPCLSKERIWQVACNFAHARSDNRLSWLGIIKEDGEERAVGLIQIFRSSTAYKTAEVAIVLRDDYQRAGLGKSLCQLLIPLVQQWHITTLHADTAGNNWAIIRLIRSLGLNYTAQLQAGYMALTIQLPVATGAPMLEDNVDNQVYKASLFEKF